MSGVEFDYVREWGKSTAPTVVLLHPAGTTRNCWTPHAESLRDSYHVVALDLPAHGTHPVASFDYDRAVEDVGSVLDTVGSAVVAGHSQGGYTAIRAAAAHSDRIAGLAIAGAAYNWRSPQMTAVGVAAYPLSFVLAAMNRSRHIQSWLSERIRMDLEERQGPPDARTYGPVHGNAQSLRANVRQRTWSRATSFDGPVLVAHGEDEPGANHAVELAERTDGRLVRYPGGHQTPMTEPATVTAALRSFLDEVYGERPEP